MPPDDGLPPELRAVSREEFRAVYAAAARLALALTKNRARADELLSETFEKLLTTRRWDPTTRSLQDHVASSMRSVRSNRFTSKGDEQDAQAHEGFHREEAGMQTESPEAKHLAHAEVEVAQRDAETELEALARSVAKHPLAPRVLACRRVGTTKASAIAEELGVPVSDVYLANDVLRDHLKKLRAARRDGEGEET